MPERHGANLQYIGRFATQRDLSRSRKASLRADDIATDYSAVRPKVWRLMELGFAKLKLSRHEGDSHNTMRTR